MAFWIRCVMALALLLGGCSEQLDKVPEVIGGLPADAPARPKTHYDYPAVHDVPPARSVKPLSGTDLLRLENELRAARDRQKAAEDTAPASAPANTGKPAQP